MRNMTAPVVRGEDFVDCEREHARFWRDSRGSAKYLRRIAPEVRVVAEKILREIAPHLYET
jgi:hypothetical protein